jgi:hypothetical protein
VRADEKLTAFIELESAIWQRVKGWEIIADNLKKSRMDFWLYLKHRARRVTILGCGRRA